MKEQNYPIQHKHRSHDNINYILKFRCLQLSECIMFCCLCVASCFMPYGYLYVVKNDFIYLLQQIIGCRGRLVESRNTSIKYKLLQFTFYIFISIFSPRTITTITNLSTRKDHWYHSSSSGCQLSDCRMLPITIPVPANVITITLIRQQHHQSSSKQMQHL